MPSQILISLLSFSSVLSFTSAHPSSHVYQRPSASDLRSPCPGLNVAANHGYLPRSGLHINVTQFGAALYSIYNFDSSFGESIAANFMNETGRPADAFINLDDLDEHGAIEQDASISRADVFFGDDHTFNSTIWGETVGILEANAGKEGLVTPASLGKVHLQRVADSRRDNPEFTYGPKEYLGAYGTKALILLTMGGDLGSKTGKVPLKFVRSFFEHERLPLFEGWKKSEQSLTPAQAVDLRSQIMATTGEEPPADDQSGLDQE